MLSGRTQHNLAEEQMQRSSACFPLLSHFQDIQTQIHLFISLHCIKQIKRRSHLPAVALYVFSLAASSSEMLDTRWLAFYLHPLTLHYMICFCFGTWLCKIAFLRSEWCGKDHLSVCYYFNDSYFQNHPGLVWGWNQNHNIQVTLITIWTAYRGSGVLLFKKKKKNSIKGWYRIMCHVLNIWKHSQVKNCRSVLSDRWEVDCGTRSIHLCKLVNQGKLESGSRQISLLQLN